MLPYWIEWLLVVWLSGLLLEQLSEQQDRSGLAMIKVINKQIKQDLLYSFYSNQFLLHISNGKIILFLGGEHSTTFICGHNTYFNCNIFGSKRVEGACLYTESICGRGVSCILHSGM